MAWIDEDGAELRMIVLIESRHDGGCFGQVMLDKHQYDALKDLVSFETNKPNEGPSIINRYVPTCSDWALRSNLFDGRPSTFESVHRVPPPED
jgi:hypothetical protein